MPSPERLARQGSSVDRYPENRALTDARLMLRYHRSHVLQSSLVPVQRPVRHVCNRHRRLQQPPAAAATPAPATPPAPALRVYVTNETSGDLTVIDAGTQTVVATAPLGKRPRGIQVSPDRKSLYVALSGSPPAPPGVDE